MLMQLMIIIKSRQSPCVWHKPMRRLYYYARNICVMWKKWTFSRHCYNIKIYVFFLICGQNVIWYSRLKYIYSKIAHFHEWINILNSNSCKRRYNYCHSIVIAYEGFTQIFHLANNDRFFNYLVKIYSYSVFILMRMKFF